MRHSVKLHGVLLGAALIAAYVVWTREPTSKLDDISILTFKAGLDRVIYQEPDRRVEIETKRDEGGKYFWVKVDKTETVQPPKKRSKPSSGISATPHGHNDPTGHFGGKRPEPKAPQVAPPGKHPTDKAKPKGQKPTGPAPAKKAPAKKAPAKKPSSLARDPKADPHKAPPQEPPKTAPQTKVTTPPAGPDAKATKAPAPAKPRPIRKRTVKSFKGNASAADVMKRMARLAAIRALGKPSAARLKAFGLKSSKKRLTLVSGDTKREFVVGGNTFGNTDVYLQDRSDGRVYVIRPRQLQDLQYAEFRLIDRALLSFDGNETSSAKIAIKDVRRELVQHNFRQARRAFWALKGEEKKRNDLYHNWINKLLRLRVVEYLPMGETPKGISPLCHVTFTVSAQKPGWVRLYRATGLTGADYYAQSNSSRSFVKLGRGAAEALERDLAEMVKR